MRPRCCLRDPSNAGFTARRTGFGVPRRTGCSVPSERCELGVRGGLAAYAHAFRAGHDSHLGAARQNSAPMSMSAWLHADASRGSALSANRHASFNVISFCPSSARPSTRFTFVSTTGTRAPNAKHARAAAPYRPRPGSSARASCCEGRRPFERPQTVRAHSHRRRARPLYPSPTHVRSTSARRAPASARSVGKRAMNWRYLGITRSTCVCCSMTSETNIL